MEPAPSGDLSEIIESIPKSADVLKPTNDYIASKYKMWADIWTEVFRKANELLNEERK